MKKFYIATLIIFTFSTLCNNVIYAQSSYNQPISKYEKADSIDLTYYGKKRPWQAAAIVVGTNLGVWAFDRYVMKEPFAYINASTIKENFTYGFVWDNDKWSTNMFMHPYHGNLYFNAARSNGFNYWYSGLYALGGSAMWELFMENEHPSINDIIVTPIGGMVIGEMTYRASDLILDDRTMGWERFGREASAFIVSPMRGLTRIINGDAWRKRSTSGRQFGIPNIAIQLSAGVRSLSYRDNLFDRGVGFASELIVEYGDRFEGDGQKLFDYFTVRANLNLQASQPAIGRINILGRLHSKDLINNDKQMINLAMYQLFDYFDSDTISKQSAKVPYRLSTPASFGAGMIYQYKADKSHKLDAFVGVNGVLLGGVLSDHYNIYKRNYNLGSGFSTRATVNASLWNGKLNLTANHQFYRLFTWKGYPEDIEWKEYDHKTLNAQGNESQTSFHVSEIRADVKLLNKLYITGSVIHFLRNSNYKDLPNVNSVSLETRLMLTYQL